MNYAYLITGSNMEKPAEQLSRAAMLLQTSCGVIVDRSGLYETEPWGMAEQPNFINEVLVVETQMTAREVLRTIETVELQMGRERKEKNGPRVIDIDILFFNHQVINENGLTVPHPRMANRRFVLEPLDRVASALIHPTLHKTVGQLLAECSDPLTVKRIEA